MSIYKGGSLIAGGSQALPLLTFMWADHQLNDVSWLRADTFSWHTGNPTTGVYKAAYAHLADDIDGKTLQSETVSGITVQFYVADDGHKICPASEESNVSAIYNATGVAWYFIIDTANQRFKLPREKDDDKHHGKVIKTYKDGVRWARLYADGWVEQGGQTGNGTFLVTMADTNYSAIVSNFNQWAGNQSIGGAVNRTSVNNVTFSWGSASSSTLSWEVKGWSVYAANASSYYNGKKYLYFYVGQFTQTALENTAGVTTEVLNGKADADLGNVSITTRSGFLFSVSQESMSAGNYYTLTFPNEIDPAKVKVNAYAVIKTANNNFAIGDVIPFESLWGQNYRPLSIRIKSTNLQFNTSDQISTNNPNNSGSGVNIASYIRMVFDVYQVK